MPSHKIKNNGKCQLMLTMNVIQADYKTKQKANDTITGEKQESGRSLQKNDGDPLFVSSASSKKEPTSSSSKRTSALKKLASTRGRRRSSLTSTEERFLSAISKNINNGENGGNDSKRRGSKRDSLRSTISSVKNNLTSSELFFLEAIANCDEVNDDALDSAHLVLTTDPLYNQDKHNEKSSLMDKPQSRSSSEKSSHSPASFRKELWEIKPSNSLLESSSHEDEEKKEEKEGEIHLDNNSPSETTLVSMLGNLSHTFQDSGIFQCSLTSSFSSWDEDDIESNKLKPTLNSPKISPTTIEEDGNVSNAFVILGTSGEDSACRPHVMSPPIMNTLRRHLPFVVQEENFWLKYSMIRDGASLHTLIGKTRNSARTVIAIETLDGDVFGSFTSSCWRPRGREYYGSGEAFLWRLRRPRSTPCNTLEEQVCLESDIEIFSWTGENRNIQSLANPDSPMVLGGCNDDQDACAEDNASGSDGSGLFVSNSLLRGTSNPCPTFNSPILPTNGKNIFEVANIEVWTLSPVNNVEQAEILESSRKFIFDNANFIEQ